MFFSLLLTHSGCPMQALWTQKLQTKQLIFRLKSSKNTNGQQTSKFTKNRLKGRCHFYASKQSLQKMLTVMLVFVVMIVLCSAAAIFILIDMEIGLECTAKLK